MPTIDYQDRKRMRLEVEFYFAAAHRLTRPPLDAGPCGRLHGHNYKLFTVVEGDCDPRSGVVADFHAVQREVQERILSRLDHRDMNEIFDNPTAENMVRWIWDTLLPG